jgi:hypothetical protein
MRFLKTCIRAIPAGTSGLIIRQVLSVIIVRSAAHIVDRLKQAPSKEQTDGGSSNEERRG